MRVVIAPDKFKGSLSAAAAARAMRTGLVRALPWAELSLYPLADGGEGTLFALLSALGGEARAARVQGPLGRPVEARWGKLPDGTAVIEAAEALSLERLAPDAPAPDRASSAGLGQLIRAAMDAGYTRLWIGVGGTATMDGGAGMLAALGARLEQADGRPAAPCGGALGDVARVGLEALEPYRALDIRVLCDVDNPLTGPEGAARVYAPQKGADPAMVERLEQGLTRWSQVMCQQRGGPAVEQPGDGAAGGLGFGLRLGLGARLEAGAPFVLETSGALQAIERSDLVVTGEGSIDAQTARGKVVAAVAGAAARAGVPVVAIGGQVRRGADTPGYPFPALSVYSALEPLPEVLRSAGQRLEQAAFDLGQLLAIGARLRT